MDAALEDRERKERKMSPRGEEEKREGGSTPPPVWTGSVGRIEEERSKTDRGTWVVETDILFLHSET